MRLPSIQRTDFQVVKSGFFNACIIFTHSFKLHTCMLFDHYFKNFCVAVIPRATGHWAEYVACDIWNRVYDYCLSVKHTYVSNIC
jgi:hypothetical protein